MEKFIYLILGVLFSISLFGQQQKVIEKKFELPTDKKLDINLKFGKDIEVNTWDKQEVNIKATLIYDEPGLEKIYSLDTNDDSNLLSIQSVYDFDAFDPTKKECFLGNNHFGDGTMYCFRIDYEITLPRKAKVHLETISGNIVVKGFKGSLKAKTISGFLDVAMVSSHPTQLKFRSVTGEIYTDFDIALDDSSTAYSKKLRSEINGGGEDLLSLETISGNIYFRKG